MKTWVQSSLAFCTDKISINITCELRPLVALKLRLINQFNFYSANIPSKARLSSVTGRSVSESETHETIHDINWKMIHVHTVASCMLMVLQNCVPVSEIQWQETCDHQADSCRTDDQRWTTSCTERVKGAVHARPSKHHWVLWEFLGGQGTHDRYGICSGWAIWYN